MHAPQRKGEVPHYGRYFESIGYEVRSLDEDLPGDFEGMGDAIWHPGPATCCGAATATAPTARCTPACLTRSASPVLTLSLTDPDFYHLDTCFCPLDEETVLIYPGAFDDDGLATIKAHFRRVVQAPEREARELFACNAHSPDGQHVLIQRGCTDTNALLQAGGYKVIELDTDEYLKSGGSVFCMKLMYW